MNEEKPPSLFANHVLQQMVQHMFGDDLVINPDDYMAMRVVFRRCGGIWAEIIDGNIVHIDLLGKIVAGWGSMPDREKVSEVLV